MTNSCLGGTTVYFWLFGVPGYRKTRRFSNSCALVLPVPVPVWSQCWLKTSQVQQVQLCRRRRSMGLRIYIYMYIYIYNSTLLYIMRDNDTHVYLITYIYIHMYICNDTYPIQWPLIHDIVHWKLPRQNSKDHPGWPRMAHTERSSNGNSQNCMRKAMNSNPPRKNYLKSHLTRGHSWSFLVETDLEGVNCFTISSIFSRFNMKSSGWLPVFVVFHPSKPWWNPSKGPASGLAQLPSIGCLGTKYWEIERSPGVRGPCRGSGSCLRWVNDRLPSGYDIHRASHGKSTHFWER